MTVPATADPDPATGGADDPSGATQISVRNLTKTYRTRHGDSTALREVSLDVAEGEILVLLGPSGCGKTTLLRSVAGLEQPDSGEITVHGRTVFSSGRRVSLPPEQRKLSMVFQSYALWPHMTVFRNVAYPLATAKLAKAEIRPRVEDALKMVGLEKFAGNYPGQLSGGQQQRVALARALVASSGVILFDEPLSNLDAKVRERLRDELLTLQEELRFTALYVTHDQTEATGLGDRIAVMEVGEVAQLGEPMDIYDRPRSRYVADFVGSANELQGTVASESGGYVCADTPYGKLRGTPGGASEWTAGTPVQVMFRPEHCRITDSPVPGENHLTGTVERSIFLGSHSEHTVSLGGHSVVVRTLGSDLQQVGAAIALELDPRSARVFPSEADA